MSVPGGLAIASIGVTVPAISHAVAFFGVSVPLIGSTVPLISSLVPRVSGPVFVISPGRGSFTCRPGPLAGRFCRLSRPTRLVAGLRLPIALL